MLTCLSSLQAAIPSPSSNVLDLGPFTFHIYGLCYAIAVLAAGAIVRRRWEAQGGSRELVYDVALWEFPAGLIGGRLYFLLTHAWRRLRPLWGAFAVWEAA